MTVRLFLVTHSGIDWEDGCHQVVSANNEADLTEQIQAVVDSWMDFDGTIDDVQVYELSEQPIKVKPAAITLDWNPFASDLVYVR